MQHYHQVKPGSSRSPVLVFLLLLAAAPGYAQQALSDSGQNSPQAQEQPQLSEVVVTARRREESEQTVPVAITALSAQDLDERHITNPQDLQGQVPSLSVSPYAQSREVEMFVIRGQGTQYTAPSAVVQYMAEVPLVPGTISSVQGSPGQFLDLADIQVLRGPQGTLFGRNTTGGAILLEPARPTDQLTGDIQLQAGNYEDKEVEVVANVPVNDQLLTRFAGEFIDRAGFTRDVETGIRYDNRHIWSGRFGVTWKPTDTIDNYLMVTGSKSETNGSGWVLDEWNIPYIEGVFAPVGGCAAVGLGTGCSVLTRQQAAQHARGVRDISLGPFTPPIDTNIEGWVVADQFKINVTDKLAVRNILSYSSLNALGPFDADGSPLAWFNANLPLNGYTDQVRQLTEELQTQGSALHDNLQYTAGLYYEDVRTPGRVDLSIYDLLSHGGASYYFTSVARAVYAQTVYDFRTISESLAGLKLTAGGRYTWDSVNAAGGSFSLAPGNAIVACTNGVAVTAPTSYADCDQHGSIRSSAPSWTLGVDYPIKNSLLLFGKVTHGYKRGGFNYYAVNPDHLTYQPEYVTTYESGFKSTFKIADVPLRFNADIFYTHSTDVQITAGDYNPSTLAAGAAVFNAASANIHGVEVEGAVSPFQTLEISFNYSHLDGEYTRFSVQNPFGQFGCSGAFVVGAINLSCMPFPYLPNNQFSITARYTLALSAELGKLSVAANYAYTGQQWEVTTQLPQYEPGSYFPSFGLLNLTANWNSVFRSSFDIGFFMTNATNKTYRITNTGDFNTIGVASQMYGGPRMYGIQLRYRW
jgi:iron complex outermembrane receptor protein